MNSIFFFLLAFSTFNTKSAKVIEKDPRAQRLIQNEEQEIMKRLPKGERMNVATGPTCMDDLGCFPLDSFYHPIYRPFNLVPFERKRINTTFSLYTKNNPKEPQIIKVHDLDALRKSHFSTKRKTKVIIHGFLEHWILKPTWVLQMRDEFLIHGDYNIIVVDWKGGNNFPYSQAVSNSRIVGAEVALFIHYLMDHTGVSPSSMHLIGHSLGAHISGYVGERVHRIARITALDPAELFFQYLPTSVRIDPSDAEFVDVIHSDARSILLLGLGMRQPCGHIDFYPNGAERHPGCTKSRITAFLTSGLEEGFRRLVSCNHQRAVDFFISSINTKNCEMVSYTCPNYEFFKKGRCSYCGFDNKYCPVMGLHADSHKDAVLNKHPLVVYLKTRDSDPFCMIYYKIEIKLKKTGSSRDEEGSFQLKLFGTEGEQQTLTSSKAELYHGSTYVFLLDANIDVRSVDRVLLKWTRRSWTNRLLSWLFTSELFVESVAIKLMHVSNDRGYIKFCNENVSSGIGSDEELLFQRRCLRET